MSMKVKGNLLPFSCSAAIWAKSSISLFNHKKDRWNEPATQFLCCKFG
jgi:hypothetical protein